MRTWLLLESEPIPSMALRKFRVDTCRCVFAMYIRTWLRLESEPMPVEARDW